MSTLIGGTAGRVPRRLERRRAAFGILDVEADLVRGLDPGAPPGGDRSACAAAAPSAAAAELAAVAAALALAPGDDGFVPPTGRGDVGAVAPVPLEPLWLRRDGGGLRVEGTRESVSFCAVEFGSSSTSSLAGGPDLAALMKASRASAGVSGGATAGGEAAAAAAGGAVDAVPLDGRRLCVLEPRPISCGATAAT